MDGLTIRDLKKILRLNTLPNVELLSQENQEKLRKKDLWDKYIELTCKNWYIVITSENREVVKSWYNKQEPYTKYKAYSIGAYYGMVNGKTYTNIHQPSDAKELTLEQFKKITKYEE